MRRRSIVCRVVATDASEARGRDVCIGSWRRRFRFLLFLVVIVRWMGEAEAGGEDDGVIGIARVRNDE
jgi:hypothetical protein